MDNADGAFAGSLEEPLPSVVQELGSLGTVGGLAIDPRLQAVVQAGRYHGVELDPNEFRRPAGETAPSAAALSQWAQSTGMWSRAVRIRWRHLFRFQETGPVVLLFEDGTAGLLTGANAEQNVVYIKDPFTPPGTAPIAVDELRLSEAWAGEAVLLRANRGYVATDAPFNFRWLVDLVLQERRSLRDIGLASSTVSILTIFPPILVMTMVNKVMQFHSMSTLILLSSIMIVVWVYETFLGYARRAIIAVVGARLDTKLNLHLFSRLLRLPLDYFERHPAGETMYQVAQVYRVREFLTGQLLATFLDLLTLAVLLPFLFWLNAPLAWVVLLCAGLISVVILAYLKPMREMYSRVVAAETWKAAALSETIIGVKTVKALALEPQRRAQWDERVAETGKWRLAFARLSNWPQTLVTPLERFMTMGTLMLGAYWAMDDCVGVHGRRIVCIHDAERAGGAAIGRHGAAGAGIRGGQRGDRRGRGGVEPALGDRRRLGRIAAQICRRDQLSGRHVHLWRDQDPGPVGGELFDPGRDDARHRRQERLGQIDDRAPACRGSTATTAGS